MSGELKSSALCFGDFSQHTFAGKSIRMAREREMPTTGQNKHAEARY